MLLLGVPLADLHKLMPLEGDEGAEDAQMERNDQSLAAIKLHRINGVIVPPPDPFLARPSSIVERS